MLYPSIHANYQASLNTDSEHTIAYEESGNPEGYPVIYCHGGPGGGSSEYVRRLFDPEFYRLIQFDQRGCGQSTPFLSLQNNTTQALIDDIELLRKTLKLKRFLLSGGSWGSTLALLYGQQYPHYVSAFLLRGIFLARQRDLAWLYEAGGAARLFSDYYREFWPHAKASFTDIIESYYSRLTGANELDKLSAARHWCLWESRLSVLHADLSSLESELEPHHALAMALLECHYFKHHAFIEENQIIRNIELLNNIPATIIHGRYDCVCDYSQADALNQAWPSSTLITVAGAGHSFKENAISEAFLKSANSLAKFFKEQQKES